MSTSTERPDAGAVGALRAAEILPERCGTARTARLSEHERTFYLGILRSFSEGRAPDADAVHKEADRLELEPKRMLAKLAADDLVHTDSNGRIVVAYPFSGRPTAHRVRIAGGDSVWAMCAIDALWNRAHARPADRGPLRRPDHGRRDQCAGRR